MAALDELMAGLRAEGVVDSEGRFTLDRDQARSKMQRFQLADARLYVLELVQAAVLRDATSMRFDIDADDMRMRFDGVPFDAAELDDLYGSVFAEGQGRRFEGVQQLAVALNAALGMDVSFIELRTGSVRLEIRPGREDVVTELSSPHEGTSIHVRRKFRFGVVLDFFRNLAGRITEEQYLRQRCRYASVPIDLEGEIISRGLAAPDEALLEMPVSGYGFRGVMSLVAEDRPAEVRLVKAGVWIDTRVVPEWGTRIVAVVEGDALRKDVSQARIVLDAALRNLIGALRSARWKLTSKAYLSDLDVMGWIRTQLLQHATRSEIEHDPDAMAVAELVSWPDCRDPFLAEMSPALAEVSDHVRPKTAARVSLQRLLESSKAKQPLGYATRTFGALKPVDPPIILVTETAELEHLRRLIPGLRSRTRALERAQTREQARLAWQARRGEPVVPDHVPLLAHESFELPNAHGQIAVDARLLDGDESRPPAQTLLFARGCLLAKLELDLGVPYLWLAVDADFAPRELYDDAVRNARFAEVVLRSLAALGPALADAHELAVEGRHRPAVLEATRRLFDPPGRARREASPEAAVRGLVKRWLALMLVPGDRRAMLGRLDVQAEAAAPWDDIGFELVPSLAPVRLNTDDADPLAEIPLFVDFAGQRLGLRALAEALARDGALRHLPWGADLGPITELPGVLRLGPTDRALLEAIFGANALVGWDDELDGARARARHMAKPATDFERELAEYRESLASPGHDPDLWIAPLSPRRGFLLLMPVPAHIDARSLDDVKHSSVDVHVQTRHLGTLELDLGCGFVAATLDDRTLTPTPDWEDVERDEAFARMHDALRAATLELLEGIVGAFPRLPAPVRRWIGTVFLLGGVHDEAMQRRIESLPILATVDGQALSLAEARALVDAHGQLEVVEDDHPPAQVSDPPILALAPLEQTALQQILRTRLVEGGSRIRLAHARAALEALPRVAEPVLERTGVLVRETLTHRGGQGEIGLLHGGKGRLRLCTAGRLVAELELDSHLPLDAILSDDALPVGADARLDVDHARVRGHLRTCHRRLPNLVVALAEAVAPALRTGSGWNPEDLQAARMVLMRHAIAERDAGESRRAIRERALQQITALPLFGDLWGRRWSIDELQPFSRGHLDVLERLRPEMPAGETAESLGRLILAVDALERQCLSRFFELRVLDPDWEDVRASLQRLRDAPPVAWPSLDDDAIAHRQSQVSGGLEALVWLPCDHDALVDDPPPVIFSKGDRELGRELVLPFLACRGIVRGPGLRMAADGVDLDDRQRHSLERQIVVLYDILADAAAGRRLRREDRPIVTAALARAAVELEHHAEHPAIGRLGKRIDRLRRKLADPDRVPPMLVERLRAELQPPTAAERRDPRPVESTPVAVTTLDAGPTDAAVATTATRPQTSTDPESHAPAEPIEARTPEQALLAEIDAELHWARTRHADLLDELGLATMTIADAPGRDIAVLGPGGIVVRREHPIVARLLGQRPFDPFDLAFVLVAVYALLNRRTDHVVDDDERAFVDHLAEALVLVTRARPPDAANA
jgi:hypothetical protein